jgi:hypothetical protein
VALTAADISVINKTKAISPATTIHKTSFIEGLRLGVVMANRNPEG